MQLQTTKCSPGSCYTLPLRPKYKQPEQKTIYSATTGTFIVFIVSDYSTPVFFSLYLPISTAYQSSFKKFVKVERQRLSIVALLVKRRSPSSKCRILFDAYTITSNTMVVNILIFCCCFFFVRN